MNRVYNFSAGPAVMPEPVLKKAAQEMLCHGSDGMSVMEMSHRSPMYESIIESAESLLRELMDIPSDYKVLFLQGGASMQFVQIPMNFLTVTGKADYIDSGNFASNAIKEAKRYGEVNVVASTADIVYSKIPEIDPGKINNAADYLHFTTNNTIFGTHFDNIPETKAPLITDMSSSILSRPYDISKYAMIYAGAQKNIGPAGVTIVIIRPDLLARTPMELTPTMLKYSTMVKAQSMYNTPPTYSIYMAMLTFEWIKSLGGVSAMEEYNKNKAAVLYGYLDSQDYYTAPVEKASRSLMNVTFVTGDKDRDKLFVSQAADEGLLNLAGHRLAGGMRASIYNAMPIAGVEKLVEFMKDFARRNPK
ncbi:MAG: 3-phosphoserine/phosphohydroxythreonine transaminase [Christensenellales bacterium]|jgi:phosphoserine aminotransferase